MAWYVGGEPFVVWSGGTHTLHLLETTDFAKANIAAFVDVNSKYHGKELFGHPVIAPDAIKKRSEPILISSRAFQTGIAGMIRNELKVPDYLILLYNEKNA